MTNQVYFNKTSPYKYYCKMITHVVNIDNILINEKDGLHTQSYPHILDQYTTPVFCHSSMMQIILSIY